MILKDFKCKSCFLVFERICKSNSHYCKCIRCGDTATPIFSISTVYTGNQDVAWLKGVTEIVDKDGDRNCQEFIKNPTRSNHKNWMKTQGLRPYESGEKFNSKPDMSKVEKETIDNAMHRYSQGR